MMYGKLVKRIIVILITIAVVSALIGAYMWFYYATVDKIYGTMEWDADALLVYRHRNGKSTLITDSEEISALQETYEWKNMHQDCDMWNGVTYTIYVYRDGELVSQVYGYGNPLRNSYNRDFRKAIYRLGRMEANVHAAQVTVPSGIFPEDVAALIPGAELFSQSSEAKGLQLIASYSAAYEGELPEPAKKTTALGEYAPDDVFLPLQEALQEEGILYSTGRVRISTIGSSRYQRQIEFTLMAMPSFETFGELELEYDEGDAWSAFLVSEEELSDADWAVLKEMGIKKVR